MGPKVTLPDERTDERTDGLTTGLRELDIINSKDDTKYKYNLFSKRHTITEQKQTCTRH